MDSTSKSLLVLVAVGVTFGIAVGVALGLRSSSSGATPADSSGAGVPVAADAGPGAGVAEGSAVVTAAESTVDDGLGRFRFEELTLVDQGGRPVDASVLDGRHTAMTFFFTSCQGPCPALTATMRRVQDATSGSGLRLLSVSVDGSNDTPGVIRAYGEANGADFDRWTFATGDPATVSAIAAASLSFTISADGQTVTGPRGNEVPNIIHPTRILLVGPDRRVEGVYAYNDPRQVDALIDRFDG